MLSVTYNMYCSRYSFVSPIITLIRDVRRNLWMPPCLLASTDNELDRALSAASRRDKQTEGELWKEGALAGTHTNSGHPKAAQTKLTAFPIGMKPSLWRDHTDTLPDSSYTVANLYAGVISMTYI